MLYDEVAVENDPVRGVLAIVPDDEIYQHMRVEFYAEVLAHEIEMGNDARDERKG